jgi:hypothetical protein
MCVYSKNRIRVSLLYKKSSKLDSRSDRVQAGSTSTPLSPPSAPHPKTKTKNAVHPIEFQVRRKRKAQDLTASRRDPPSDAIVARAPGLYEYVIDRHSEAKRREGREERVVSKRTQTRWGNEEF